MYVENPVYVLISNLNHTDCNWFILLFSKENKQTYNFIFRDKGKLAIVRWVGALAKPINLQINHVYEATEYIYSFD